MTEQRKTRLMVYILYILLILLSRLSIISTLQCKNENNIDVDWYVLYKIPKIQDHKNPLVRQGVAYAYMDSKSFINGWTLSHKDISSNDSIPAYTLAPIYDDKNSRDLIWLLYNDQPPNQMAKMMNGHSKGTFIGNEKEGFWLIHSVPNFPPEPNNGEEPHSPRNQDEVQEKSDNEDENKKVFDENQEKIEETNNNENEKLSKEVPIGEYAYPFTGRVNGQSFLCISTKESSFDIIGKQLIYNQIIVYKRNLPNNLTKKFQVLTDAANQVRIKKAPFNNKVNLYSTSGMQFISFAKGSKWNKELYDDFVAPLLDTDLFAETWLNGRGRLPSDCSKERVMNIKSISLSRVHVKFKSTHDHSKWVVAANGKKKNTWVCVGDINRAHTQFDRGGGTVCFNLPEVWKNYKDAVSDVEPCPKEEKKGFFRRIMKWFG